MSTVIDAPFNAASATGADLAAVAAFAGIPASQQPTLDPNEYDFFEAISYKFHGGFRGMVELVLYAGCVGGFISLQVSNSSIYSNVGVTSSGLTIPFDDKITDYTSMMSYIVMLGVGLSLVRIVFADKFVKEVKLNRIFELIWGLVIWALFLAALVITFILRGQLKDALARVANGTSTSDIEKRKAIQLAQKQADTQIVIMGLAVGATTLLTAYNVYDLFQAEQLKIGAGLSSFVPPPQ
jgi:hypothetical protein